MTIILGIDTGNPVTVEQVRDAYLVCFTRVHREYLSDLTSQDSSLSQESIDKLQKLSIEGLAKQFFREVGGDFDHPTKEYLLAVLKKTREYESNFSAPEEIERCTSGIMDLIDLL
jgi:hypothetical protein